MDTLLHQLRQQYPVVWENPSLVPYEQARADNDVTRADIDAAEQLLERSAPWIATTFSNTDGGIIESPLFDAGDYLIKLDSHLPVSGSIKARGGIFAVLALADELGGSLGDRDFFSQYRIVVASTGNLGLSIGIMSSALGFQVEVHMSRDARAWKKEMLRNKGCAVIEHDGDFTYAVGMARASSISDDTFFIDDENSRELFFGYAVAGRRLKAQLEQHDVRVDEASPLHVYLPCGVGGGPGGVLCGLKTEFGDNVKGYFVEPVAAPSMLLGLATRKFDQVSVTDIGLDGRTAADGLAVGRTSAFVGKRMRRQIDACVTVEDDTLFKDVARLYDAHSIGIEPSAAAGFAAYRHFRDQPGTHVVWATGGAMVPDSEMAEFIRRGRALLTD